MVTDMENVIRSRRKELGLSQEELAKKCGVSRQTRSEERRVGKECRL